MKTHQVVDFGKGPQDHTQDYPFEGTEQECAAWIDTHQEQQIGSGKGRFAIQEIPIDED